MPGTSRLKIQVLVDNSDSWIIPFAKGLVKDLRESGHEVLFRSNVNEVDKGDILFLLGCTHIFKRLELNKNNLVVHESNLPLGKGWSPLTWQIIEGKNEIPICLFEAVESVDAGPVYLVDQIHFEGHELIDELRQKQGEKTVTLCRKFVESYDKIFPAQQEGKSTYYEKRTAKDSELDINKSLKEQFNLLRVVDNERYPAFFRYNGHDYILKISKSEKNG